MKPERAYELIAPLATGGTADLFIARAVGEGTLGPKVVVKRLFESLTSQPHMLNAFIEEARIGGIFNHPNVISVLDFGFSSGVYFLVMELADGHDLLTAIELEFAREQRLPLAVALSVASDVCEGLAYVHSLNDKDGHNLGIVHRDLSPGNVLLTASGAAKLADFGTAKQTRNPAATRTTRTGTVKGKAAYLAPERLRGEPLTASADVFGVGILLYELFTGYNPFEADSEYESFERIVSGEIPPLSIVLSDLGQPTGLDLTPLDDIAARSLRREPSKRPTCAEIQSEIDMLAGNAGISISQRSLAEYLQQHERELATQQNAQRGPLPELPANRRLVASDG